MIKEALEYLVGLAAASKVLMRDGDVDREYFDVGGEVLLPPAEPLPSPLGVTTLESLVSYLTGNRDGLQLDKLLVHVLGPARVDVLGPLSTRHRRREALVTANAQVPAFRYGEYLEAESFNVALQTIFADSEDRPVALKIASGLRKGSEVQQKDDGLTQQVSVNRGVSLLENVTIKNPVKLRPWRTFPEVEQPVGLYVLRLREATSGVQLALFDADGGAWELAARKSVAEWLTKRLKADGAGDAAQVIY